MSDDEQRIGLNVEVPPVRLGSVTSLDDRRKIQSLERQVANLTEKLALAGDRVKPTLAKSHSSCAHHGGYIVDDNKLEVTCELCGAVMDPYRVLRNLAHEEVNFCFSLNSLREERARLSKEVESLKGKRARLRSQVSKATPDTPLDDVAAAMEKVDADSILIRKVGGAWGAWMHRLRDQRICTPAMRSIREAVARIVTDAMASDYGEEIAKR